MALRVPKAELTTKLRESMIKQPGAVPAACRSQETSGVASTT
jgi:hypothetical protein